MELRPGYKQTDAGLLPRDWKSGPLGSFVERLDAGASVNSEKDVSPEFETYPCILKTGAAKGGSLNPRESKKVAARDLPRLAISLRKNTILISRMNTVELVGESGYVDRDFPNLFVPDRMWMATVGPDSRVHPRWFSYVLTWRPVKSQLSAAATGTSGSMKNISKPSFRSIEIPYPPVEEQEAIAGALSDADALIESLEQLLAKKRHLKQGAMQELLTGKKRLPGFTKDWTDSSLGSLGTCHRGVSYKPERDLSPSDGPSTVRLLRSNNVRASMVVLENLQFVDEGKVSTEQRLRPEDILICMANGSRDLVGKAGRFQSVDGFGYTFGAFMGCFRPNPESADPNFVFYLFLTANYRTHIGILLAGSSINNLTPTSIEALELRIPFEKAEQAAIAAVLSDMDAEIDALEARLTKARQIKQGMMQELLTGRIRLV